MVRATIGIAACSATDRLGLVQRLSLDGWHPICIGRRIAYDIAAAMALPLAAEAV